MEETTGQELEEGVTQPSETPPDYKVLYEAALVAKQKLENDVRSERGQRQKQSNIEERLTQFAEQQETQNRVLSTVVDKVISGDFDGLTRVRADEVVRRGREVFTNAYRDMWTNLEEALHDEKGSPLFDVEAARKALPAQLQEADDTEAMLRGVPALREAYELWMDGTPDTERKTKGDVTVLSRAVSRANTVVRGVMGERSKADIAKAKTEEAARMREEHGLLDLSSGPESSSGGEPWRNLSPVRKMEYALRLEEEDK
jgi:hypothetical protein|tara:strand:- start:1257 stop:2030 length:774 start_codon:yes stop_codon:yes gene_type:complete